MAYITQEMKVELVKAVKAVLPKDWKASFSITDYAVLTCTISKAPVDLKAVFGCEGETYNVNQNYLDTTCKNEEVREVLKAIVAAMNGQNYNKSDVQRDYFDVGYYITLQFGSWKKDFVNTAA